MARSAGVCWAAITLAAADLKTAPGFSAQKIHLVERATQGSWIALAADDRGRLYTSDQYGPLYRIELPRDARTQPRIAKLNLPIGGAHGLTWIKGSLYVVAGQKAVCPTGLYRLRDTDADGELDHVELLQALEGDGEHGPHAVVAAPDGESLYVLAGNATRLPSLARSRVPPLWGDDSLLAPLPALMGSETRGTPHGGWICRTDLDGKAWELVCVGFRNAYSLAFDIRGELFTFDSDTEFEINLPWYRPTRVLHAVSGADFGWRRGALKVPEHAPDNWPSVIAMGLGSPTAVLAPAKAKFPARHRDALWVADWSYGKIFALHLQPRGGSFAATREEIVSGLPLPITAMCVNPVDGAIYFTTGGRRLQSALYRVTALPFQAEAPTPAIMPPRATRVRRAIELLHGSTDSALLERIWPDLDDPDGLVRSAARVALETQPLASWRDLATATHLPRQTLAALLALARVDAAGNRSALLQTLLTLHEAGLERPLRGEWLRVLALTWTRGGEASREERVAWAARLRPLFPFENHDIDAALLELLVYCEAPDAAQLGLAALRSAVTREAQLDFARSLRVLRTGWTPALRREFFAWLGETHTWRGGASFGRFLQKLRDDAVAAAPEADRAALREQLAVAAKQAAPPSYSLSAERRTVREWSTDDLTVLAQKDTQRSDPVRGRQLFGAVGCFGCHAFAGEGGALGPDLSAVGRRFGLRDLIEAIVEPSREISDQYGTVVVTMRDGRKLSGRITNLTETGPHLAENLADPSNVQRLAEADIAAIEPSKTSLMPAGLLNVLSADEVLDLLAFLRAGGERTP